MPSYPILPHPMVFHPIPSYPIVSHHIIFHTYSIQSYPTLCYPILSHPTHGIPLYPILYHPMQSLGIPSYPIHWVHPILSYSILFLVTLKKCKKTSDLWLVFNHFHFFSAEILVDMLWKMTIPFTVATTKWLKLNAETKKLVPLWHFSQTCFLASVRFASGAAAHTIILQKVWGNEVLNRTSSVF